MVVLSKKIDKQIKDYFLTNKKVNSKALTKFFRLYSYIKNECENLLKNYPEWVNIGNIIFAIKNNTHLRNCKTCGKLIKFNRQQRIYCNNICRNHDPILIATSIKKFKNTCLKKYGFDNPHKSKSVIDKARKTCLDKYGVDNPAKIPEVQEKIKITCLKKYGVKNVFQSPLIQAKISQVFEGRTVKCRN